MVLIVVDALVATLVRDKPKLWSVEPRGFPLVSYGPSPCPSGVDRCLFATRGVGVQRRQGFIINRRSLRLGRLSGDS